MKRKLFTAFVILGSLAFTACQEDAAMDEMEQLLEDTELNAVDGDGDGGDDDNDPTSGS